MSYDTFSHPPDDAKFTIPTIGFVTLKFTCPRCREKQSRFVTADELFYGFNAVCTSEKCTAPGECPGYEFDFYPSWMESILGLKDRPLH
jgi:hypothetical protein